jgi:hypothetical protein
MSDQQPWPATEGDTWNARESGGARRGRDGEVIAWDGGSVTPGGEPARPAEVIVARYDVPSGPPPGGRRGPRSVLIVLLALLVVAILAIVLLVVTRPTKNSQVSNQASTSPSASATSPRPSPSSTEPSASSAANPATTAATSPGASTQPGAAPSTVGATGGGVGAQVADLSALTAVQSSNISGPNPGPEQIGATIYQNSVGFTCYSGGPSYIDYNVAGYKFLNALIGIPSGASNAAGNSMTITFFKDGSSTQLGSPVTVSLDHPQSVHLNLDGSSQLEISCAAISQTSHSPVSMDGALGNATIGPS